MQLDVAAGDPWTRVARRWSLALQVVRLGMNNHAFAHDGGGAIKADRAAHELGLGVALGICGEISEVPGMSLCVGWATVLGARGIEMATGGRGVGRGAIAFVVNMKAMVAGSESAHLGDNANASRSFEEIDRPAHVASRGGIQLRPRVTFAAMIVIPIVGGFAARKNDCASDDCAD